MTVVEYQFTEQEAASALSKGMQVPRWHSLLYSAVVAVGVGLIISGRRGTNYSADPLFSLGYLITFLGLVLLIFSPLARRANLASHVRKNAAIFTARCRVAFDEQRLVYETPETRAEVAWTWYRAMSEDQNYFYLLGGGGQVMSALPKHVFDEAGRAAFLRCSQAIHRT